MTKIQVPREVLQAAVDSLSSFVSDYGWLERDMDNMNDLIALLNQPSGDVVSKPNCTECTKWTKEQADNREWVEGVAEGRRIVEKLAAKELQCRSS